MRTSTKKTWAILLSALMLFTLCTPIAGVFSLEAKAFTGVLNDAGGRIADDYLLGQYYSLTWDGEGNSVWSLYDGADEEYNGLVNYGDAATYNSPENGYYIHGAYARITNQNLFQDVSASTGLTVAFRYIPDQTDNHRHILSLGANEYTGSNNAKSHFYISATNSWMSNNDNVYTVPFIGYVDENGGEHINCYPEASAPAFQRGTAYDVVVTISATEGVKYNINGTDYNAVYHGSNLGDQLPYIEAFLNAVKDWHYNYIGCSRWADGNFSGWLKNLRIYGRAFTKAQINTTESDYFTANYNTLVAQAKTAFNVSDLELSSATFNTPAYHQGAEATGAYSNLVYSPIWTTSWSGNGLGDTAVAVGRQNLKLAIPRNVVMVYDGKQTVYAPVILETKCNQNSGDTQKIHYVSSNSSTFTLADDWVGSSVTWDAWVPNAIETDDSFAFFDYNNYKETSQDMRNTNTSRFWYNTVWYGGTGNTAAYYDHACNLSFHAQTSYKESTGSRQWKEGDVTALTDFYAINYAPIRNILNDAKAFYNSNMAGKEWMYTEASYNQAILALYLIAKCNPNNYNYATSPRAAVRECARDIQEALSQYSQINLVKKTGTVYFKDDEGNVLRTYENKEYGFEMDYDTIDTSKTSAASVYTFTGWNPSTVTVVQDAEKTYTATYDITTRYYTITYLDADGTQMKTESVAYNDYPTPPALPSKAADANYHYTVAWNTTPAQVTGDATYTVVYTPVAHSGGTATCQTQAKCSVCQTYYGELGDHNYGTLHTAVTPSCTTPGNIAYYQCSVCQKYFNEAKVEVQDVSLPAGHNYGEWIDETPASCAAAGEKGHYHCSGCNTDFDAEYNVIDYLVIPKADHEYGDWAPNNNGTHTKTCINCPAGTEGHSVSENCHGGEATCYAKATCIDCGGSYGNLADHSYGAWAPNGNGTHTKTCANCPDGTDGHSVTENCTGGEATCLVKAKCTVCQGEYGDLADHTYGEWINETPASCDGAGEKGHYHCDVCGKNFDEAYAEIDDIVIPAAHNYGEWINEISATCAATGTKGHYHCSLCGNDFDAENNLIEDLTIPKADHSYGAWAPNGNGTHTKTCSVCPAGTEGKTVTENCNGTATCQHKAHCSICGSDYGDLADHTYGEWIQQQSQSCVDDGVIGHYHCSVCGKDFDEEYNELDTVSIPAIGAHFYGQQIEATSASCTVNGMKAHYHCEICGRYFDTDKNEVTAASLVIVAHHSPVYVEEIPATETENGVKAHFDCQVCHKHFREEACVNELSDADLVIPAFGNPEEPVELQDEVCPLCGEHHATTFFGRVTTIVHMIVYILIHFISSLK